MNFSTNASGNVPGGVRSKHISTRVLQPPGGASSWSASNQFESTPSARPQNGQRQQQRQQQQHYTQAGAEMARRAAMEQEQFAHAQEAQRPTDARQRGTSTGGGGSSFNPFAHNGQGTYTNPYTNRRDGGAVKGSVSATSVASASDMSFLTQNGGKATYDMPASHNPKYGVT